MKVSGRVGLRSLAIASGTEETICSALDHAQVVVGDERERAPAHPGSAVEDDRAGLGDGEGAGGDDPVGARRGRGGRGAGVA